MHNEIVRTLAHKPDNPRNSEGAFQTLGDGRIMFAYSRYRGDDWRDDAIADIAAIFSHDGGQTWTPDSGTIIANEGACNVMSVSFLRLAADRIALFYLRKNSFLDCRPYLRVSNDEGITWGEPKLCIPAPGYFVVNNDRVVQLGSGRIIIPAAYHRARAEAKPREWNAYDARGIALFFISDDGGRSWRESADWHAFPGKCPSGLQEPGVVELSDGRLYGWCRTEAGCQYEMYSEDHGDTWSVPKPSRFRSPNSPMSIKRIPSTGDLLAVWNDHSSYPQHSPTNWSSPSWGRTPLAAAISKDEGQTWSAPKLLETNPERGFCYIALHFTADAVLLAYCCGGNGAVLQDSCIRRVSLEWLYA